jgi:hypothetical protein
MIDLHGRGVRSDGLHRTIKLVMLAESVGHLVGKDHALTNGTIDRRRAVEYSTHIVRVLAAGYLTRATGQAVTRFQYQSGRIACERCQGRKYIDLSHVHCVPWFLKAKGLSIEIPVVVFRRPKFFHSGPLHTQQGRRELVKSHSSMWRN